MRRSPVALLASLLALIALLAPSAAAQFTPPKRATVELLLNTDRLTPGQQGIAAIVTKIDAGWHTQSSQPLDPSFIPFHAKLAAEPAMEIADVLYPPGKLDHFPALGGTLSVYDGTVLTFVPFVVPQDAQPGEVTFTATVRLQACNDEMCDMPSTLTATAKTTIVAAGQQPASQHAEVFGQFDPNRWLNKHPTDGAAGTQTTPPPSAAAAGWIKYSDEALAEARRGDTPVLVKFTAAWCVNCHVVERLVFGDAATRAELDRRGVKLIKVDLTQDGAPGTALLGQLYPSRSIPFTAIYFPGNDTPAPLTGIYSSSDLFATLDDAGKTIRSTTSVFGLELGGASLPVLILVAIGIGILLNAVPCVLPVLPLKAMSFYEDANHDRSRSILNGVCFALGIIATFGGLALFVITQDALWGKFISHPVTAVILAVVLLAAAAQAFGLFEIVLPRSVTKLESKATGSSLTGNFLSGILIAVLSTPCTIGVFAAIIAVAIKSGSILGTLTLMFVGVGMALPWLVLSAFPEATRKFPRTGPWPGVVKQMTAFLLVATAIFFAAPLMPPALREAALWWLIFACVAAAAIFLLVRTMQIAPRPRPIAISSAIAFVLVGVGLTLTLALNGG